MISLFIEDRGQPIGIKWVNSLGCNLRIIKGIFPTLVNAPFAAKPSKIEALDTFNRQFYCSPSVIPSGVAGEQGTMLFQAEDSRPR